MDFSIGSFALNSLWKKPKNKRRYSLQQKICGLIGFTFSPKSSLYHFIQPIKESKRHRYHQLKFSIAVFFFFFCVYYTSATSKKSKQTKMMIGYLNLCIKTDAHFVTVMGHLCGFGEVFVRLWVWSLYGHSAVCMRLQCGVCAILVHYNTVFVRLRCDFAFGADLS